MTYVLLIYGRWAAFEFLGGALLADLHLSKEKGASEPSSSKKGVGSVFLAKILMLIQLFVLIAAGYIISWPPSGSKPPIYTWMQLCSPSSFAKNRSDRFWFALAAFATVWACGCLGMVARALESSPLQYAGRLSFAFNILQHPFLNICELPVLGEAFKSAAEGNLEQRGWGLRGLIGQSTPMQRTVCWFIGLCVLGSFLICIADVFSRTVDVLFVKAARKFENLVFVGNEEDRELLPIMK
jgi:hypothetical protein